MNTSHTHTDEHHAVFELIPMYVNNNLSESEIALVEKHLLTCDSCQREVEFEKSVQESVEPKVDVSQMAQRNLATFNKKLDAELARQPAVTTGDPVSRSEKYLFLAP